MTSRKSAIGRKVLVTGSRGKSSIVRYLHAAFQHAGLESYARITGVVPRELGPAGVRTISRTAGAHVEEMRWWLNQLPASTDAVILENSAITQEFQNLAERWLQPDLTVLCNVLPDHQEAWGDGKGCAAKVLGSGIPRHGKVVLSAELRADPYLLQLLDKRCCQLVFVDAVDEIEPDFHATNLGLALVAAGQLGIATAPSLQAMLDVKPDCYDFRVLQLRGADLAMAFSANDINSTRTLFQSLCWSEQETRLIYNHRKDRPGRLNSFINWLVNTPWREVLIIGDKPRKLPVSARYLKIKNGEELQKIFHPGDQVFGCGNIAGLPLSLITTLD